MGSSSLFLLVLGAALASTESCEAPGSDAVVLATGLATAWGVAQESRLDPDLVGWQAHATKIYSGLCDAPLYGSGDVSREQARTRIRELSRPDALLWDSVADQQIAGLWARVIDDRLSGEGTGAEIGRLSDDQALLYLLRLRQRPDLLTTEQAVLVDTAIESL